MKKLKCFLKKFVFIRKLYSALMPTLEKVRDYNRARSTFNFDKRRYLKHSRDENSYDFMIFKISMLYHVVEKGLSMPNMRPRFGVAVITDLISRINIFLDKYKSCPFQVEHAISVLLEYKETHDSINVKLDPKIESAISALAKRFTIKPSKQIDMSKSEYFSFVNSDFSKFSSSRHSVRNFSGGVSIDSIKKSVELANNAPSACNRQPCKVHLICDKGVIRKILSLQNGNRGFGHLIDKMLVLTVNQSSIMWAAERNDIYTNAGIYLMNLLYSLHYNKIASCTLNWSVFKDTEISIHGLLGLKENENVVALVGCGDVPEKFKLAKSPRISSEENLVVHT